MSFKLRCLFLSMLGHAVFSTLVLVGYIAARIPESLAVVIGAEFWSEILWQEIWVDSFLDSAFDHDSPMHPLNFLIVLTGWIVTCTTCLHYWIRPLRDWKSSWPLQLGLGFLYLPMELNFFIMLELGWY